MRVLLLPLLACTEPSADDARRAWLVERLIEANAVWLAREPEAVEHQFAKMDADPYDFLRGTASVFLTDLARPVPGRAPTSFLTLPDASVTWVVGDPHLENLGTSLVGPESAATAEAVSTLEWVDLDAAARGPWTTDTRRAALALVLLFDGCGCADRGVEAFARAYAGELESPGWDPAGDPDDGRWADELRADAREDGLAGEALADRLSDEPGALLARTPIDDAGEGFVSLTADEEALVAHLTDQWSRRPAGWRALDAVRQYGKGVASFSAPRFLVAWDTGDDGAGDDHLLQLREVIDPPAQPGAPPPAPWGPERIDAATALWSTPDADVLYAGVTDGVGVYKVSTSSGWFRTFDHGDVIGELSAGDASVPDAEALGALVGRALARAHADANGAIVRDDLRAGGGVEPLVHERVRDARSDLGQLLVDAELFHQALATLGPALGAEGLR
ncbi:MAG: DUF2252 family protein [Myxococcota bacterium]